MQLRHTSRVSCFDLDRQNGGPMCWLDSVQGYLVQEVDISFGILIRIPEEVLKHKMNHQCLHNDLHLCT